MQNLIQYYICVFLPQCQAADDKRRAKPRHPSCYEVRTCCKRDGSNPVPWEHCNEDKLRTCQINISQTQQLLTDPKRSTNTEPTNSWEPIHKGSRGQWDSSILQYAPNDPSHIGVWQVLVLSTLLATLLCPVSLGCAVCRAELFKHSPFPESCES